MKKNTLKDLAKKYSEGRLTRMQRFTIGMSVGRDDGFCGKIGCDWPANDHCEYWTSKSE